MQMNKDAVLAALEYGQTVCCGTSRWHVGVHKQSGVVRSVYKFNVLTGDTVLDVDFSRCFVHTGGVGSDD